MSDTWIRNLYAQNDEPSAASRCQNDSGTRTSWNDVLVNVYSNRLCIDEAFEIGAPSMLIKVVAYLQWIYYSTDLENGTSRMAVLEEDEDRR